MRFTCKEFKLSNPGHEKKCEETLKKKKAKR